MSEMLKDLKVLDITSNVAGPVASAMLADYGAYVIHVEKPVVGDDARNFPPKVDNVSLANSWLNRGKKSITLDLKDPEAIAIIKRMLPEMDVLVESNRPGVMERLGLDYDTVKAINPGIVYCSISVFGQKGPYARRAGFDLIAQAFSGFMHLTGDPDGPPMKSNFAVGDFFGAINAFGSIMTALYYKQKSGVGQHIDVSLARTLIYVNTPLDRINIGLDERRTGNHDPALCPYGVYEGKNGQNVVIAAQNPNFWAKLCKLMGREDMIEDPRYIDNVTRSKNRWDVIPVINAWLETFDDINDAAKLLDQEGIPNIRVFTHTDIVNDPHVKEMQWMVDVPVESTVTSIPTYLTRNVAAEFSEAPGSIRKCPTVGEDNYEVLTRYGLSQEEIDTLQNKWKTKLNA